MKPLLSAFMLLNICKYHGSKLIQPNLGHQTAKILKKNDLLFKDLNQNGKVDKYEDWRLPIETRVQDLIAKMTIEEKVGFMLISTSR